MTSAAEALRLAVPRLAQAGVADPSRDARRLLAHAMGIGADRLILHLQDTLREGQHARYEAALCARLERQPVSQITGLREFFGRPFKVTADTLDPRPDTETLIEAALTMQFRRVLDLGTGTGCILLTLLAERPDAMGLGVDLSEAALQVARDNGHRLDLGERSRFLQSDWFSNVEGVFDLIVANPPYIAAAEMQGLDPEVRDWEPHMALTPGGDGLDAYRMITSGLAPFLAPAGAVIVEIGPTQGEAVCALMRKAGLLDVTINRDIDGRDRLVLARK